MKKTTHWLSTAAVIFTFNSMTSAQETVSSYEQSLTPPTPPPTTLDLEEISNQLQDAGWHVEQQSDGSLVARSSARNKQTPQSAVSQDQWQSLQTQLNGTGWVSKRNKDGSLSLFPPIRQQALSAETGSEGANSFEKMERKLRQAGWQVTHTSAGDILLYPPEKKDSNKVKACPGIALTADVSLPVDTWKKAHRIAQSWLSDQENNNSSVGRIRKIINIYIISIVSQTSPHRLIQQIAIRNHDGAIIVLN